MTAGAHESGDGFGKSAGVVAARGVAVTAIAVLVGVLLMVKGLNETDSAVSAQGTTTTVVGAEDTAAEGTGDSVTDTEDPVVTDGDGATDPEDSSTTTVAPVGPRPPAEVTVLILNGSGGIAGVAARGTAKVTEAGYATAKATDAKSAAPTLILYVEGYEADAIAVAAVFGVDPAAHVAPYDPDTSPVDDIAGAQVIVRIGNDQLISV